MKPTLFFESSRTGHLLMSITDPECIPNIGDIVVIELAKTLGIDYELIIKD